MKTICPACNQHLEYGDDFAGTTAPCPKCGAEVSFPNLRVCPDCGAEARAARRGLWSEDSPVAPWEWRKRRKEN